MRNRRRFRPGTWDALEGRVVLSRGPGSSLAEMAMPGPGVAGHRGSSHAPAYPTPTAEINLQFALFTDDVLQHINSANLTGATDTLNPLQNYIRQRTLALTQTLVAYFNHLPIKLPKAPGPYRTPRPRSYIQQYIGGRLIGGDPNSLINRLVAITPTTTTTTTPGVALTGPAVALYEASVLTAIEASQQEILDGVSLIFAGQGVFGGGTTTPPIPAVP